MKKVIVNGQTCYEAKPFDIAECIQIFRSEFDRHKANNPEKWDKLFKVDDDIQRTDSQD